MATENQPLPDLIDAFVEKLLSLCTMLNDYNVMGGTPRKEVKAIRERFRQAADAEIEEQRPRFARNTDQDSIDFDQLQKDIRAIMEQKIEEAITLPFSLRLEKDEPKDVFGMKPDNFIQHNIVHYGTIFQELNREEPALTTAEKAHLIATDRLGGTTPTERTCDITLLPSRLDTMIHLFNTKKEVFKKHETEATEVFGGLLHLMKKTALDILDIRDEIRKKMGMEPVSHPARLLTAPLLPEPR